MEERLASLETALKYERDRIGKLEQRLERHESMNKVQMVGFVMVGLMLSGLPSLFPFMRALIE